MGKKETAAEREARTIGWRVYGSSGATWSLSEDRRFAWPTARHAKPVSIDEARSLLAWVRDHRKDLGHFRLVRVLLPTTPRVETIATLRAERNRFRAESVATLARVGKLRDALIATINACPGSGASADVSDEFLCWAPDEVKGQITQLTHERDHARKEIARLHLAIRAGGAALRDLRAEMAESHDERRQILASDIDASAAVRERDQAIAALESAQRTHDAQLKAAEDRAATAERLLRRSPAVIDAALDFAEWMRDRGTIPAITFRVSTIDAFVSVFKAAESDEATRVGGGDVVPSVAPATPKAADSDVAWVPDARFSLMASASDDGAILRVTGQLYVRVGRRLDVAPLGPYHDADYVTQLWRPRSDANEHGSLGAYQTHSSRHLAVEHAERFAHRLRDAIGGDAVRQVEPAAIPTARAETPSAKESAIAVEVPVPMILTCPACSARHVDAGRFATKAHHTHSCQECGLTWRPAVIPTVGVQFLPGFKDAGSPADGSV